MKKTISRVHRACRGRRMAMLGLAFLVVVLGACGGDPVGDDDDDISIAIDAPQAIDATDAPPTVCGDGVCQSPETAATCAADCSLCGNGVCNSGEQATCPTDCAVCGNGVCESSESNANCANDCPICGDGVCTGNEPNTCVGDCVTNAALVVRNQSSYSVWYLYLRPCGGNWSTDQLGANIVNPGAQFTLSGIPPGCWDFRAETSPSVNLYWLRTGTSLAAGQTFTWTLTN
jgi:hypothetical protein